MINTLESGILLEDINILLPWGISKDELQYIAKPVLQESRDRICLYWNGHLILGDIKTQIEAVFYRGRSDLRDHPNANGDLHMVSLNFKNIEKLDPRKQHDHLKTQFIHALGKPSFDDAGETAISNLPFTEWDLADVLVVLMVFERFGEYCTGEIRHKPLPAWRKPK
jgi:hypothetical protein